MALFLPPSPDSLVEEEDFTPPPVESFVPDKPTPIRPPDTGLPTFQPPIEITPEGPIYSGTPVEKEWNPWTGEVSPQLKAQVPWLAPQEPAPPPPSLTPVTAEAVSAITPEGKRLLPGSQLPPAPLTPTVEPQYPSGFPGGLAGEMTDQELEENVKTAIDQYTEQTQKIAERNPILEAINFTPDKIPSGEEISNALNIPKSVGIPISTADKLLSGFLGFLGSTSGASQAALAEIAPLKPLLFAKWSTDIAASGGEQAANFWESLKRGDMQGAADAGGSVVADALMLFGAKIPGVKRIPGLAEGTVRSVPGAVEAITRAAVINPRTRGVDYGANHPEILERQGEPVPPRSDRNTPRFGYETTERPFVTRPEAATVAEGAAQKLGEFDEKGTQPHSDQIAAEPGGTVSIGESSPESVAKEIGFTVSPEKQFGSVKLTGLTEPELAKFREAGRVLDVEFTDKRPDSPTKGVTFYVPENASRAEILQKYRAKLAEFGVPEPAGLAEKRAAPETKTILDALAARSQEANTPNANAVRLMLRRHFGMESGGPVRVIHAPESDSLGTIWWDRKGKPVGIQINAAKIKGIQQLRDVLLHEVGHWADLTAPKPVIDAITKGMSLAEKKEIIADVKRLKYEHGEWKKEFRADAVRVMAAKWAERNPTWWQNIVANVSRVANEVLGIKLSRLGAENAAARSIAIALEAIKSKGKQYAEALESAATVPESVAKDMPEVIRRRLLEQVQKELRKTGFAEKKGEETPAPKEQPETMGVRQSTREDMAKRGEPVVSVRGEGTNLKQALTQGREILGRDPAAAERALEEFNNTGRLSERDFNVSRAKYEQVMTEGRKIEKQFGTDSPEYHAARMEAARWSDVTKRMQTEWHRLGMGQQGETDIDTGSVLDMETKHKADTGKDFTPDQRKRATVVAGKVDAANTAANSAREALYNETARGKSLSKAEKDALDAASKTVREAAIRMAEAQNKARVIQAGRAREVADLQVKAAKRALDAATKRARESAVKAARAEQKALADPARALWDKAKEYIDQGMDNFDDIRNKLATDLGMSVNKVTKLMTQTKRAKFLADDMWRKQQIARRMHMQAKIWLNSLETPLYQKAIAAIPRGMFSLKVGFHGTVALGTHAPMVAFQPRFWKTYIRDFAKMYKMIGKPSYYEQQIQDLQRRPNYITAQRAGLINDPFVYEEYAVTPLAGKFAELAPKTAEFFNKMTGMGNRGYSVLKILRQDMFDQMWNKLPKTSQIPEMAAALAKQINHATGVTQGRAPTGTNIALFAPKLEGSRVMWLIGDPIRAANIMLNWKNANIGERAFAMNQIKEKLWVAGTMFTGLALNQGFLSATDSEQKINGIPESLGGGGFDPTRSDFLKFKAAGLNMAYGNAMVAMARLPIRLFVGVVNEGKINKMVYDDETTAETLFDYARSQLSPFAGTTTDLFFGRDFQKRVLPRAGFGLIEGKTKMPKRLAARGITEGYTWPEYWTLQLSPIPFQEALKEVWGKGLGMTPEQMAQEYKAFATLMIMMGTGARVSEDIPYQTRIPRTFKEAIEKQQ